MANSIALSKYRSIKQRSFDNYLELFLICSYITDESLENATIKEFQKFKYDDDRIQQAIKALQVSKSTDLFNHKLVSMLDKAIEDWNAKNRVLAPFKNYFYDNRLISQTDFIDFYGEDKDDNRSCDFCGITEGEIVKLINKGEIKTKRLSTRGKTMEIDRLEANKGYEKGNIVKCCYWCNNAKTDEFSAEEFEPIGLLIGYTLRKRLKK
jgi:hypothetical protein